MTFAPKVATALASLALGLGLGLASGCAAGARRTPISTEASDEDLSIAPAADLGVSSRDLAIIERDFAAAPSPLHDLATPTTLLPADLAPRPDLAPPPTVTPADLGSVVGVCTVRINELATGTTTSGYEEFIELFNPCATAIDLRGYSIVYRSAGGAANITLFADVGKTISSSGYLLFAGSGYYTATRDGVLVSGLAENGGGVALVDSAGAVVDSLGWGTATNAFVQGGTAAAAPGDRVAPGRSIARTVDGKSTGRSAADFALTSAPTPKAANQIVTP